MLFRSIGGNFDSLLAKLIITGATREEALARARRALAEFHVGGLATALPFHRAIVNDPAYTEKFSVYTSYIETEFINEIPAFSVGTDAHPSSTRAEKLTVEVDGHRFDVAIHAAENVHKRHRAKSGVTGVVTGDSLTSPMQGTVVKFAVNEGDSVDAGDLICVLEAMKMEQPLNAHKSGTVKDIAAKIGETITSGSRICSIVD